MRIAAITLEDFRAWESLTLAFDGGITALQGGNGSGKTTILEAAWYAAALGSHRTSSDEVLVRRGKQSGIVRVDVARSVAGASERLEKIELEVRTGGRARTKLGGAAVPRRRDVLGVLRAAIFAPERVAIVRGDPGDRRRFADELLVQLHPRYHAVIKEYERALRQRNALLRDIVAGRARADGLDAWDEALAKPGGELAAGRAKAIAALAPFAGKAYGAVGDGEDLTIEYAPRTAPDGFRPDGVQVGAGEAPPAVWTDAIRVALQDRRRDETVRGTTLAGPHRDDVQITIGGLPARTHASQGEAWMAAVGVVLGAHDAIAAQVDEPPVLLLDDAFNPLDPVRRDRLAGALPRGAQILISAADPAEVPASLQATVVDVADLAGRS